MLEREIVKPIVDTLEFYMNMGKLLYIRNNRFSGAITRRDGSKGYIKNVGAGSPDIIVAIKGVTLWLEIKTDTGFLSAHQKMWKEKLEEMGHAYYMVRSFDAFKKILDKYNL